MEVEFTHFRHEEMAGDRPNRKPLEKYIRKKRFPGTPEDVWTVIEALKAAPTAADLPPMYHYHLLSHGRTGTAAIDIPISGHGGRGPWRMILRPVSNCNNINQQKSINRVTIEELIENYHNK